MPGVKKKTFHKATNSWPNRQALLKQPFSLVSHRILGPGSWVLLGCARTSFLYSFEAGSGSSRFF